MMVVGEETVAVGINANSAYVAVFTEKMGCRHFDNSFMLYLLIIFSDYEALRFRRYRQNHSDLSAPIE